MARLAFLAALVGCYQPTPVANTPCTTSEECPRGLTCFDGHCSASPPDPDAPIGGDGPMIDAPAAAQCPAFALQCDDFESGDLDRWTIVRSNSNASVGVTGEIAHTGGFALDARVPALPDSGSQAYIARRTALQSTGMLATRAWFFASGPIVNFAGVLQDSGDDTYALVSGDTEEHWAVSEQSIAGLVDHQAPTHTAAERWTCVELDYIFTPAPTIELYVDDELVVNVKPDDPAPAYHETAVGVTRAPTEGFRVFVDDVVVANQHIGCN